MEQEEGEYINPNEIAEQIVADRENEPEPVEDDDGMDAEEVQDEQDEDEDIVIDMSNNSWSYFDKHTDSVFVIAAHPKLPLIVTGGGDNTAYIWTSHSQPPKFAGQIEGHKESVVAASFTSSGNYVITGDMTGVIQVYASKNQGQKWVPLASAEEVTEVLWVSVHEKEDVFAFGGVDGSVWVYSINENGIEQIMSGFSHQSECNGGVFYGDNADEIKLATISEDGSIVFWNCYTNTVLFKIHNNDFKGLSPPWVSLAKTGSIITTGSRDGYLAVVNSENGHIINFFQAFKLKDDQDEYEASIEALSFCDTQPILAVGLVSGDLILYDCKTWRPRRAFKLDDAITKLQFIQNSPILVGASMNGRIYKWDSRSGEELFAGVGHNMGVLDFSVVENGKKLITAGDEGVSLIFVHES